MFAANDLTALGLLQGFLRHGLRVPEDVALVGYDDIEFAESAAVPLSSVRQPREELGRRGAEILLAQLRAQEDGEPVGLSRVRFTPELVVRRSSEPRAGTRLATLNRFSDTAATLFRPVGRGGPMKVALFVTCLADTVAPQVGVATVRLLERLGHEVVFPRSRPAAGRCT